MTTPSLPKLDNLVSVIRDSINTKLQNSTSEIRANIDILQADVNTKANDSSVVHTSGNESISGTKTFSSNIVGNVTGNASTATKATNDSDGNQINTTYIKQTDMKDFNIGACFVGFYSLVSRIGGVGNGGSLTVGSTTSASNIYDTITVDSTTVTCSKNITLVGVWKLVSIIRGAVHQAQNNFIEVNAANQQGIDYILGVSATQGLFVRVV